MVQPVRIPSAPTDRLHGPLTVLMAFSVGATATACDSAPTEPAHEEELVEIAEITSSFTPDEPFYWYDGGKIFLEVRPGLFVVHPSANAVPAARDALAGTDLGPVELESELRHGHDVVSVGGVDPDPVAAHEVARLLHDHADLTFASPVYRREGRDHDLYMLNTVAVRFEEETTPAEIEALNAELGATVVREASESRSWYTLEYPHSGDCDILWIAAAYEEHPLATWSDPNKLGGGGFFP